MSERTKPMQVQKFRFGQCHR